MKQSENKMGYLPIPKLIMTMSLPAVLSMMVQALYNIVDSIFVAKINEEAITALSLAFPVQLVIVACFVGMGVGINSSISRKLGAKDTEGAMMTAEHGFLIAGVLYGFVALLGLFFVDPFVKLFTEDALIIRYSHSYLTIIMLFAFGRIFAQVGVSIFQGTGEMLVPMVSQLIGAVTNIILDPILIFGYFGLPALGVPGAAIATIIAQIVSMIFVLLYLTRFKRVITFKLKGFHVNRLILKQIVIVGLPAAAMQALASVMLVGLNLILAGFTTTAVAVLGIYYKLQSFVFMPVFGLSQGLMPIVGYNYGARNKTRLTSALKLALGIAFAYMTLGLVVFQLFSREMILLFSGTEDMLAIGKHAFRIISMGYPLAAISIVISTAFQGLGDAYLSMIVAFIRQIIVLLPLAALLGKFFGIDTLWYAFFFSEVVGTSVVLWFYQKTYRTKIAMLEETSS
ncbi:MATE family efflux transporter [Fusibacter paucivorans]|uniref:Probable multidrug resistance protein NorM n=1 Tax=Fusibacter paucivorans TaxID=76009 RepID=A0ABS5PRU9_9FIRM|nr:MATE family efflux transporter [Fusibacter paucivorans]MBS7527622.1 MATE family efflux transporter [Fusibacter paucivorans]